MFLQKMDSLSNQSSILDFRLYYIFLVLFYCFQIHQVLCLSLPALDYLASVLSTGGSAIFTSARLSVVCCVASLGLACLSIKGVLVRESMCLCQSALCRSRISLHCSSCNFSRSCSTGGITALR